MAGVELLWIEPAPGPEAVAVKFTISVEVGAIPVPPSGINQTGIAGSSVVMMRVADFAPVDAGLNVTLIVQLPPAVTEGGGGGSCTGGIGCVVQVVPDIVNMALFVPVILKGAIARLALELIVKVCAAEVLPIPVSGKVSPAGSTLTAEGLNSSVLAVGTAGEPVAPPDKSTVPLLMVMAPKLDRAVFIESIGRNTSPPFPGRKSSAAPADIPKTEKSPATSTFPLARMADAPLLCAAFIAMVPEPKAPREGS